MRVQILEYHPQMLDEHLHGGEQTSGFMYPSGVDRFKRQFAHLEENYGKGEKSNPLQWHHASLPRERVPAPKDDGASQDNAVSPNKSEENPNGILQNETGSPNIGACGLLKSASISLFGLRFSVEEDLHHHRRREGGSGFNLPFRRHLRNRGRRH